MILLLLQVLGPAEGVRLERREDSPTDVCARWSHQSEFTSNGMRLK